MSFSATPGAAAEEFEPVQGCLDARISANEPVAECVKQVQSLCLSYDAPSMAGADCYRRAKDHWGGLISERMQRIRETASEQLSTIAAIEVKYDLKGNLMQCDRMEELSLVQKDPDDGTVYIRLRCEATAVGMAFAKLYYQSQQIK
ncbi:MAG: hypothetical protein R3256_01320 [Thalassovita sp.]|nr:hypothetical protein [Thalassovita sp.]